MFTVIYIQRKSLPCVVSKNMCKIFTFKATAVVIGAASSKGTPL